MSGNQTYNLLVPAFFDVPWCFFLASSPGNQFPSSFSVLECHCSGSLFWVHWRSCLKTHSMNLLTTPLSAPLVLAVTTPLPLFICLSTPDTLPYLTSPPGRKNRNLIIHSYQKAVQTSLRCPKLISARSAWQCLIQKCAFRASESRKISLQIYDFQPNVKSITRWRNTDNVIVFVLAFFCCCIGLAMCGKILHR